MVKFKYYTNSQKIAFAVSKIFIDQVKAKPNTVFILATGSSPLLTYQELVKDYQSNHTDWSHVTTFNLDEYVDLNPRFSDQSYRCFMDQNLFNVVNIKLNHTHFPTPNTVNGQYEQLIANANGVDIALLGVGVNGHIAFNEPRSPLDSITRIVNLTPSTRQANARFFNNNVGAVPKQAITCGLQTILNARRIILIATGHAKKLALTKLMHTKIYDPHWPITALHSHTDVTIYTDQIIK